MKQWTPDLPTTGGPRYIEIAEAIRADIEAGRLVAGDRLPPQRRVAQDLGVDFSTVSRGYAEAVRRGYIESFVGRGTFVRAQSAQPILVDERRAREEDPMMNMPPEPDNPALLERMTQGVDRLAANLVPLLRYQSVTGSLADQEVAVEWMQQNGLQSDADRLVITPGAHASLTAILSILAEPGQVVLCEDITYPGLRSIAACQNLQLRGLKSDEHGILPASLEEAITELWPAALYLNPTLQNPTALTIPAHRRAEIASILRRYEVQLIEDDAYCFVASDAPPPISALIPDLSWHVAGISKCFGAGLRLAYTTLPDRGMTGKFSQVLRAMHVMASPLSLALLGGWIEDGTARAMQEGVREAARERQDLASKILTKCTYDSAPEAFNIWLSLPPGTSRAEVLGRMANRQIGIMPSDAFTIGSPAPEALRVCLGGPISPDQLKEDLIALQDAVLRKDWLG